MRLKRGKKGQSAKALALAGLLGVLAACAPNVLPVQEYVNPTTQERTCVQGYGDTRRGGFSINLSNDAGNFQLVLTRNYMRGNQNRFSAANAEFQVPVVMRFADGSVHDFRARGTGNNQSPTVSFDVMTFPVEESFLRKLLATTTDIQVTYSGRAGSTSFAITPDSWVALREGFGQTCMS